MGVNPPFLIFAALLVLVGPGEVSAGVASCLKCHLPHYQTVGSCSGCHGGDIRSHRKAVAHHDLIEGRFAWFAVKGAPQVERGKELVTTFACRRCHVTAGKGNRLASDLDRLPRGTTPRKILEAIDSPAALMPKFHFAEREMTDLVNVILAGGREAGKGRANPPQVVHFSDERDGDNVFDKQCGSCHMILTRDFAGLGKGDAGPNLSGLLSPNYPASFRGKERWSRESLKNWLENPRKIKKGARMRPVRLKEGEMKDLLNVVSTSR